MSEEEIMGTLKMIQDQQTKILETLDRMEARQIVVKQEVESEVQGSFASRDQ